MVPARLVYGRKPLTPIDVLLDSPATRHALSFLKALFSEYHLVSPEVVNYTWDLSAQVFASGNAAMAIGGTYESFFIRENAGWDEAEFLEKVGFVPIPAGPTGEPTTLAGGMNYVLYHQSQSVEKSLTMLKMTVEADILKPFCVRTGQIPAQAQIAHSLSQDERGFVAKTIPLLERARTRPSLPGFARVSAQFRGLIEDCLTDRRSIDQAVTLTSEKITAITDLPLG
jgi:ABC-type glycerol-3-phosphate transport system substrate-binding protein